MRVKTRSKTRVKTVVNREVKLQTAVKLKSDWMDDKITMAKGRHQKQKRLSFGHCPKGGGFNRNPKVLR